MNLASRTLAFVLPCVLAALAALAVLTGTEVAEPPVAVSAARGQAALQPSYATCRDQHQPSSAAPAQAGRAEAHHLDPHGRSQRPSWVQHTQGDIERCLRGAPDSAQAAREPARYARRP